MYILKEISGVSGSGLGRIKEYPLSEETKDDEIEVDVSDLPVDDIMDPKDGQNQETAASAPEESPEAEVGSDNLGGDVPDWEGETKKLQAELSELKDQYLRKQADFDNYRKRIQKEKQESIRYGNASLLGDLIEVIDNFERAIKSSADSKDFDNFHQGIVMIEQQFVGLLEERYGMKRLKSLGEEFNPSHHEAIAMASEGADPQVVVEEFQKGYLLHDRVLRTAKVKVGSAEDYENTKQ
jgi:molecular chaperone GrpE